MSDIPEWGEPAANRTTEVQEISVNIYQNFARVYDAFGSESFCLTLLEELQEVLEYYCLEPGNRVLDLACGTGVITTELSKLGFSVTGLDLSPDMLAQAKQRAALNNQNINFVQADLREFRLGQQFEAAICTHDSLDHLFEDEELDSAFERISEALADRAIFIFDMNCWPGVQHLHGRTTFAETDDRSVVYEMNAVDQSLETTITGFIKNGTGGYDRFCETLYQRCYSEREIQERLDDFGLKLLDSMVLQQLEGEPFKRMWVTRKTAHGAY